MDAQREGIKKSNHGTIAELICMNWGTSHKISVRIKLKGPSQTGVRTCEARTKKISQF
jgi:hypothetical protein